MINQQNTTCLFLITIVLWFVVTASAAEPFAAGTGTPNDPYKIETTKQLLAIEKDHTLLSQCYVLMSDLDLDPNLGEGLIFDQAVIAPGNVDFLQYHAFSGVFNGNNHTIRNLAIHSESEENTGLFGSNQGLIRNLRLEDCHISGVQNVGLLVGYNTGVLKNCFASGLVTGVNAVGGLAGQNRGLISHCSTDVSVMGEQNDIGGVVGKDDYDYFVPGIIEACDSRGNVNGYSSVGGMIGSSLGDLIACTSLCDVTGEENIGGLVGTARGTILRCQAQGTISGKNLVGGLVGQMNPPRQDIYLENSSVSSVHAEEIGGGLIGSIHEGLSFPLSDCYSIGNVQGSTAGGLIGALIWNYTDYDIDQPELLVDCYAAVDVSGNMSSSVSPMLGGFIGHLNYNGPRPPFFSSLWDAQISGQTSGVGLMTNTFDPNATIAPFDVPGKTTAQMTDPNTFIDAGWDFEGTWIQLTEQDYPSLSWEHMLCE